MEVRNSESPPPSVQTSEAMPVCVCVCCVVGYHYNDAMPTGCMCVWWDTNKLTYNTVRK